MSSACSDDASDPRADTDAGSSSGQLPVDASTDRRDGARDPDPADAGDDGSTTRDSGTDAQADAGLEEDAGDAGSLPTGWQALADVAAGLGLVRVSMTSLGSEVWLTLRDTNAGQALRVMRWHGADSGPWTDLGIANQDVTGTLQTPGDPQERNVGLASLGAGRLVIAYRQGDVVYGNVYDGTWGEPVALSSAASPVAVASNGDGRAVVAYRASDGGLGVRHFDVATGTWAVEQIVSTPTQNIESANDFWLETTMAPNGDALILYRGFTTGSGAHSVYTARYAAGTNAWTAEAAGILTGSIQPTHLCLAGNAQGAAVAALRESFTNPSGTFTRTRASQRAAGATGWGDWSILDGATFFDGCGIAPDATGLVVTRVAGALDSYVPYRYAGGAWSAGDAIDTLAAASGSRLVPSIGTSSQAAAAYFRNDNEIRLFRYTTQAGWSDPFPTVQTNPMDTRLDQFFKSGRLLDDGRYLWVYQTSNGALRYLVHR